MKTNTYNTIIIMHSPIIVTQQYSSLE